MESSENIAQATEAARTALREFAQTHLTSRVIQGNGLRTGPAQTDDEIRRQFEAAVAADFETVMESVVNSGSIAPLSQKAQESLRQSAIHIGRADGVRAHGLLTMISGFLDRYQTLLPSQPAAKPTRELDQRSIEAVDAAIRTVEDFLAGQPESRFRGDTYTQHGQMTRGTEFVRRQVATDLMGVLQGAALQGMEGDWSKFLDRLALDERRIAEARAKGDVPTISAETNALASNALLQALGLRADALRRKGGMGGVGS